MKFDNIHLLLFRLIYQRNKRKKNDDPKNFPVESTKSKYNVPAEYLFKFMFRYKLSEIRHEERGAGRVRVRGVRRVRGRGRVARHRRARGAQRRRRQHARAQRQRSLAKRTNN